MSPASDGHPGGAAVSQLLRIEDVAESCGVSRRTVYRWIHDGLPVHRLPGSGRSPILRVSRDDLDAWLGQYRHDFAAEGKPSGQKIRLEGRRFLGTDRSFSAEKNRLDFRSRSRSGAAPLRGRGT